MEFPAKFYSDKFPFLNVFFEEHKPSKFRSRRYSSPSIQITLKSNDINYDFSPKYSPSDLNFLIQNILKIQPDEKFIDIVSSNYIIFSVASWYFLYKQKHDCLIDIPLILKALIFIPSYNLKKFSYDLFIGIFREITNELPDFPFEKIEDSVKLFLDVNYNKITDSETLQLTKWTIKSINNSKSNANASRSNNNNHTNNDNIFFDKQKTKETSYENQNLSLISPEIETHGVFPKQNKNTEKNIEEMYEESNENNENSNETTNLIDEQNIQNTGFDNETFEFSSNSKALLTFITQRLKEKPGYFTSNDAFSIIQEIRQPLAQLDLFSLNIFVVLANLLDKIELDHFCTFLFSRLNTFILSKPPFLTFNPNLNQSLNEPELKTTTLTQMIPSEIKIRIRLFAEAAKSSSLLINSEFWHLLSLANVDQYCCLLLCTLYLFNELGYRELTTFFCTIFKDSRIFMTEKLDDINMKLLRFCIVEIILSYDLGSCILAYWYAIKDNDSLKYEFLNFLIITKKKLLPFELANIIHDTYFSIQRDKKSIAIPVDEENDFDLILITLINLKVLNDSEMINICLLSEQFRVFLFCILFDNSYKETAFYIFENNLLNYTEVFSQQLNQIIQEKFFMKSEREKLPFITFNKIIGVIIGFLEKNPKLSLYFHDFILLIYKILANMKENNIQNDDKKYLKLLLHSFIKVLAFSPINIIDTVELGLLSSIDLLEGSDPSSECFMSFIQLLSGNNVHSLNPDFLIRNPHFLPIFVKAFMKSSRLLGYLKFVQALCNFSSTNCHACHIGKFDLALLELVKASFHDKLLVNTALKLFTMIASVASSIQVVQQFITLFFPFQERFQSPLIVPALIAMDELVAKKYDIPTAFLPISNDFPYIEVTGINENLIQKGFTAVFWIYVDNGSLKSPANIFSMCDVFQSMNMIVFVQYAYVIIRFDQKNEFMTLKVPEMIPTDRWTFIAITFDENNHTIRSFINNKTISIPYQTSINFASKKLIVKCGDDIEGGSSIEHPVLLASVALFPILQNSNCLEMSQESCFFANFHQNNAFKTSNTNLNEERFPSPNENEDYHYINDYHENYIFIVIVESQSSILCLKLKSSDSIDARLVGNDVVQPMPFVDIFIKYFKIDSLIPLFAQLNVPPIEGIEIHESFLPMIINVIFHLLKLSDEIIERFISSEAIKIINYIIMNSSEHLTINLYMQVYALVKQIPNFELQVALIHNVLLNEKLWKFANDDTLLLVVQQWIIYIRKNNFFSRKFSECINNYIFLFWLSEKKSEKIRHLLVDFLLEISKRSFTDDDLKTLLNITISLKDSDIVNDMLDLVVKISHIENGSPFKKYQASNFVILHHVYRFNNANITIKLIQAIIELHKTLQFNDLSLKNHINIIANLLANAHYFTEKDLVKLIDIANCVPEALPICFLIASNEKSFESTLAQNIKGNPKYELIVTDSLWPIYAAIKGGEEILSFIISFVINSSSNWTDSFIQALIISNLIDDISGDACREFLLQIGRSLLLNRKNSFSNDEYEEKDFRNYLNICYFFMFYGGMNLCLLDNFNKNFELFDPSKRNVYTTNIKLKKPENAIFMNYSVKTGMKISVTGIWEDSLLALQCVQVIIKKSLSEYSDFALFLMSFLIRSIPEASIEIFPELITKFRLSEPFLAYFKQHCPKKLVKLRNYAIQSSNEIYDLLNNQFDSFLNEFTRKIISYQNKNCNFMKNYVGTNEEIDLYDVFVINNQLNDEMHESKKIWQHLWKSMTMECSPWHYNDSIKHWKRNSIACSNCFIPAKMKQNFKFDDHREASFCRDLGCIESARRQNKEYKKKLKQMTEKIPKILQVSSCENDNRHDITMYNTEDINNNETKPKTYRLINFKSLNGLYYRYFREKCQLCTISKVFDNYTFNIYVDSIQLQSMKKIKTIKFSEISYVFWREPLHYKNGIEIFTYNGKSYFIIFKKSTNAEITKLLSQYVPTKLVSSSPPNSPSGISAVSRLSSFTTLSALTPLSRKSIQRSFRNPLQLSYPRIQTMKSPEFFEIHGICERWQKRQLSNFQYLMLLNIYSGRSFNKASMYPILPWVISDFTSEKLDLNDENIFRDLSKPVGCLGVERMKEIKKRVRDMEQFGQVSFLYSSYSTSPLCVYLWLMRMEPFTTLHIQMQSGKFDHAARLFASVPDSYRMVTSHMNDFRELTPEFYFQPDFLVNLNEFDLGVANGNKLNNVILPPWAKDDYFFFIYVMRKALECDKCTEKLPDWIDLVWGYKQRGKAAFDAENTYDPNMYDDVWSNPENSNDDDLRKLIEATLKHCGQIPNQMFTKPHPKKYFDGQSPSDSSSISSTFNSPLSSAISSSISSAATFSSTLAQQSLIKPKNLQIIHAIEHHKIIYSTIKETSDKKFKLILVLSNGSIHEILISEYNKIEFSKNSGISIDPQNATAFTMLSNEEIIVSMTTGALIYINTASQIKRKIQSHSGKINCISISAIDGFIVSGGADTIVNSYKVNKCEFTKQFSVPSYRSEVVCSAISREYHMIVVGTSDSYLIFIDSVTGRTSNVIKMNEKRQPRKVIISRSWGFVMVFTTRFDSQNLIVNEITVYSINGWLLNSCVISAPVVKWITWPSHDGFDFAIMALGNGKIVQFEVYFLDVDLSGNEICKIEDEEIVAMSYIVDEHILVAVLKKGEVRFIPNVALPTDRILYVNK
ncbi:hypothetical protein TRFO_35883 [Tritrichomonas foetus]|uniref:BEACH domain-containing protein n=1 Tax=Tritrichomonas foetus TaxID=1144522 RepID=A0A1J4JHW8_9EUKA|nr:hypothetical protein TRFO_35883 [Tritrichomonas foetus]|eukprot:OHS97847.1 hypothetical protein TRFO_35883 [Tritrichomonas foetus]